MSRDTHTELEQRQRDQAALRAIGDEQKIALDAIRQAETKATSLLGLFGAALAAALVLATRTSDASWFAMAVLGVATAPLLGSVLVLLSVLRARLGGQHGFMRWAQLRPDALIDQLARPAHSQASAQADRLAELSALALAKFRRVNVAIWLLTTGLPLVALAALTV